MCFNVYPIHVSEYKTYIHCTYRIISLHIMKEEIHIEHRMLYEYFRVYRCSRHHPRDIERAEAGLAATTAQHRRRSVWFVYTRCSADYIVITLHARTHQLSIRRLSGEESVRWLRTVFARPVKVSVRRREPVGRAGFSLDHILRGLHRLFYDRIT